jgi:hypothetical protein
MHLPVSASGGRRWSDSSRTFRCGWLLVPANLLLLLLVLFGVSSPGFLLIGGCTKRRDIIVVKNVLGYFVDMNGFFVIIRVCGKEKDKVK